MKRTTLGIIVIVLGVVLVILAPVWKWGIAPAFIKLPDDLNIESKYEGTLKLFADPEKMVLYPKGQEKTVPLSIVRIDKSVPSKSDSEAAVIEETVTAKDPAGNTFIEWKKYFALDRKTSENVSGHNSDRDRTGYYVMLPMGAEKKTYQMWDDDIGKTGPATFAKVETLDGKKSKNVAVYVYDVKGAIDPMVAPPLGLPAELSGKQIKEILNNPGLALPDNAMFPIEYLKKTDTTIVAEPLTGAIVDLPVYREEYYVNAALPGQQASYLPIAILDYQQTDTNVADVIDDSAKYFGLLDLATLWLPLLFIVVGAVVVSSGLFLVFTGSVLRDTAKPEETADTSERPHPNIPPEGEG